MIANRIPCFIEKPVAPSSSAIQELIQASESNSVFVQVGFNFRYAAAVKALKAYMEKDSKPPISLALEFRSKHPNGPEWGFKNPVEAWLRNNGIHAFDLVHMLSGDTIRAAVDISRETEHRFIVAVLFAHRGGSHSLLRLGNLTGGFEFKIDLLTCDMDHLFLPHLGRLIVQQEGKGSEQVLYRTPNLDDGWARGGYGPELETFFEGIKTGTKTGSPSLVDALQASLLCDLVLQHLAKKEAFEWHVA